MRPLFQSLTFFANYSSIQIALLESKVRFQKDAIAYPGLSVEKIELPFNFICETPGTHETLGVSFIFIFI